MTNTIEIVIEAVDRASGVIGDIGGAASGLASTLGKGLAVAGGLALAGIGAAGGMAAVFVNDAKESQTVGARLEAQLAALGEASNVSAGDVNTLADQISKITGFDDEALVQGQTTLLRFGDLSKEQFAQATKAASDLAAMTGMDLSSAFQQVGVALDNPEAGFGRLKRQVGDLTDAQKEQIKTAIASGDTATAQGVILDALAQKTAGAGERMGSTFQGQMDRLALTFGNIKEDIGAALLPTIQMLADKLLVFVQSDQFQQWIASLSDWLQNKLPVAIQQASTYWTTTLQPALQQVGQFITTTVIPVLRQIWQWLSVNLPPAIQALAAFWNTTLLPAIQAVANFLSTNVIPVLQVLWDWFSTSIPQAISALRTAWETDFMGIRSMFEGVWTFIQLAFQAFTAAFNGDWYTFGATIRQMTDNAWTTIKNIFSAAWTTIKNIDWLGLGKAVVLGMINGVKNMAAALKDALVNIAKAAYEAAKGFLGIKSPSKLFMELGAQIPAGMAKGISGASGMPIAQVGAMSSSLVPAAVSALPSGGGYGGANVIINYSPMIATGSTAEFEAQFVPLVDRAMRRVNRGR